MTNSYYKLKLDDLNADGLARSDGGWWLHHPSQGIFAWLGSISGFAATTSPTNTGSADRLDVGDFDRDGLSDIAAAATMRAAACTPGADQGVRDPIGAWTSIASPQITGVMNALGYGDFNRDGDLDVVMSRDVGAGLAADVARRRQQLDIVCNITTTPGAQTGTWLDVAVGPWGNIGSINTDVIATQRQRRRHPLLGPFGRLRLLVRLLAGAHRIVSRPVRRRYGS